MLANETHATTGNISINHYPGKQIRTSKPAPPKLHSRQADELQVIKGIGPKIEKALNTAGIRYYRQIADFTQDNINWVNQSLDFHGRIEREEWIEQAQALLAQNDHADSIDTLAPALLDKPLNDGPDDLKRIKGIGLVLEKDLQQLGIYHYQQLATMNLDNSRWLDEKLGFPGRTTREHWVAQAQALVEGKTTEYSTRFDQGQTPYKD